MFNNVVYKGGGDVIMKKKGVYTKVSKKFPASKLTAGKPLKKSWQSKLKCEIVQLEFDRNVLNNIITNHLNVDNLDKNTLALLDGIKKRIPVNHMTIQ